MSPPIIIHCPSCSGEIQVGPEHQEQEIQCPHCAQRLRVPRFQQVEVPAQTSVKATANTFKPPVKTEKKRSRVKGCLPLLGGIFFLIFALGAVGYYFYKIDSGQKDYARQQIEALNLSDEQESTSKSIAHFYHTKASNSGERLTKKSQGTISNEQYWKVMQGVILEEMKLFEPPGKSSDLIGGRYIGKPPGFYHYSVEFMKNGDCIYNKHVDTDAPNYKKPTETHNGTWSLEGRSLTLSLDNGKTVSLKILVHGKSSFATLEGDEIGCFWKQRFY